jgi:cytochrome c biogenesis protein ResB
MSEKLVCTNHTLWRAHVLAMLRSAQLDSFLEGTTKSPEKVLKIQKGTTGEVEDVPNPVYMQWRAQEQQVLSFLLTSVSREVLIKVVTLPTAAEVWRHIDSAYASHSRAWIINTRMALATTQKGASPAAEYITKMKTLANDMASAGKKLDDDELCSYILAGLDFEYNSLVSSIVARVEPISFSELYSQLLAFESRLELQGGHHSQSSANATTRGHGGF